MTTLEQRYEKGQAMLALMAGTISGRSPMPGIDQLAPDLRRIIDEALYGSIWTRPYLSLQHRCICTISALMALGELPSLRRHIERCLNVGMSPEQVVEVFIQLTFYVGVPATERALRITKELFEERGIKFTPTQVYDTQKSVEELYDTGVPRATHQRISLGSYLHPAPLGRQKPSDVFPVRNDCAGALRSTNPSPNRGGTPSRDDARGANGGLHPGHVVRRVLHHPHRHADSAFGVYRAGPFAKPDDAYWSQIKAGYQLMGHLLDSLESKY